MTDLKVLGIDLAKNVFQLHGVDSSGKTVLKGLAEKSLLSLLQTYPDA